MKKTVALLLALTIVLSIVGCAPRFGNNSSTLEENSEWSSPSDLYSEPVQEQTDNSNVNEQSLEQLQIPAKAYTPDGKGPTMPEVDTFIEAINKHQIWFESSTLSKDAKPSIVIIQNGTLYYYTNWNNDTRLTLGELSQMTDDDIIGHCSNNMQLDIVSSYEFHAFTDNSGNITTMEYLRTNPQHDLGAFPAGWQNGNVVKQQIYDSWYYGIHATASSSNNRHEYFYTKCSQNASMVFDAPTTSGIIMEASYNNY